MHAFYVNHRQHVLAILALTPYFVHLFWPELESLWFAITAAICAECV